MERPQSIIWFERLYLGQLALGLLNTMLNWGAVAAQIAVGPRSDLLPSWFMVATLAVSTTISLLLWFFIARQGSAIAKWILAILFALGLIGLLANAAQGTFAPTMNVLGVIVVATQAVAVFMLFRADAKPWFAR